jgi:hypothetical protein
LKEAETVGNPRNSTRESRPPERFCSYVAMVTGITESEPSSYEEAATQHVWREAMVEEYASIMQNDVWEVVLRPDGKSVISFKWIYKIKYAADGSIEKYKARFVARGFSQRDGLDYSEVLPPKNPKADKIILDFDFEGALSKMHVNVPLKEAVKIPSIKERFNTLFSGMAEPMDTSIMLQADHFRIQYGENPPFFMTLMMNNKYLNNCMLDTGVGANMMSLKVMQSNQALQECLWI